MGQGFTVAAARLQAGSREISSLGRQCEAVAVDAIDTLAGMAGSAGHPGLASVQAGAAGEGTRAFADLGAVYQHVSTGLTASADTYASTERGIAARAGAVFEGLRWAAG